MDLHSAVTVASIMSSTVGAVKNAVDLSAKVDNRELKHELSDIMTGLLQIQATVMSLQQENQELRSQLESRATVKRDPKYGYYFADGDEDPLCPKCLEKDNKRIHMGARISYGAGGRSRQCDVCLFEKVEQQAAPRERTERLSRNGPY